MTKRSDRISLETQALLAQGESLHVDFKRAPNGISADDLIAFANSAEGGCILAGIEEKQADDGTQIGVAIGCDVDDSTILLIANKALSCLPPIAIEVGIENLAATPFLRIDVPSSKAKPHCSPKGVYCRRDGSRNRALHPSELLQMFLESEARAFAEKFEAAADRISADISALKDDVEDSIDRMAELLGWADSKLGDSESKISTILAYSKITSDDVKDNATRLRSIFRQDKRADPIVERERRKLQNEILDRIRGDDQLRKAIIKGQKLSVTASGKAAEELSQEDLRSAFGEAARMVQEQEEELHYAIDVKDPSRATSAEMKAVVQLIEEGGEVVDGIEQRLGSAEAIGFVSYDNAIVGCGAMKNPDHGYRNGVFRKAKATVKAAEFPHELGWVYIMPDYRGKGAVRPIKPLMESLMSAASNCGVYATTRSTNDKMQRILEHQGFVRHGSAYPSTIDPKEQIQLFIRSALHTAAPE